MCRGTQQATGFCFKDEVSVNVNNTASCWISCELCGMRASLYCQADDAYLCRNCDKWVHEANFLARRHVRCFLCNTCQSLTQRYLIGVSLQVLLPTMVSWVERRRYNSKVERKSSRILRTPFLFL